MALNLMVDTMHSLNTVLESSYIQLYIDNTFIRI